MQKVKLFDDLLALCPSGGFERHRLGGSSGEARVDADFFKFISKPANLPRKAHGIKFVFGQDFICCIHIPTTDATNPAIKMDYSPPRQGSAFHLPASVMEEFPLLFKFTEAKAFVSLLLNEINKERNKHGGPLIQPHAVAGELASLHSSRCIAQVDQPAGRLTNDDPCMLKWSALNCTLHVCISENKHTSVCHPCGHHRDVFAQDGLENKVCFSMPGRSEVGRGGDGPDMFVFALLDWRTSLRCRIRQHFLALGGNPEVRPTQKHLDECEDEGGQFAWLHSLGAQDEEQNQRLQSCSRRNSVQR